MRAIQRLEVDELESRVIWNAFRSNIIRRYKLETTSQSIKRRTSDVDLVAAKEIVGAGLEVSLACQQQR